MDAHRPRSLPQNREDGPLPVERRSHTLGTQLSSQLTHRSILPKTQPLRGNIMLPSYSSNKDVSTHVPLSAPPPTPTEDISFIENDRVLESGNNSTSPKRRKLLHATKCNAWWLKKRDGGKRSLYLTLSFEGDNMTTFDSLTAQRCINKAIPLLDDLFDAWLFVMELQPFPHLHGIASCKQDIYRGWSNPIDATVHCVSG